MPYLDQLSETCGKQIADLLETRISGITSLKLLATSKVTMHESLTIWLLPATASAEPDTRFTELVVNTGTWHHQIHVDGKPVAFAVTKLEGPGAEQHSFAATVASEMADKVALLLAQIDTREEEGVVRFLTVPAFYVQALWLHTKDADTIFPVQIPERMKSFAIGESYTAADFLHRLSNESLSTFGQ